MKKDNSLEIKTSENTIRNPHVETKYKSVLAYLGYIGTLLLSAIQGYSTRHAVLPVYPYYKPRIVGWLAPASFLAMYGTIGGFTVKKKPKNMILKRKNILYIIFTLAGAIVYTVFLILGIKGTTIFSVGMDYSVYDNKRGK